MSRILVDPGRRIVYTQAVNPLTVAQVRDHRERLHNDARFDPEFDQILSFRVSMRSRSRRRIYAH